MAESPDLQGAIAIEAVEWASGEADRLTITVRGRWRRRRPAPSVQPVLVIEADGRRHRFRATPEPPGLGGAPPGGWQMTFTVPAWLAPHLGGRAWLQLGLAVIPLPRAVGPAPAPADPDTLSERRMRTAELAEQRARARVSEAEAVAAELAIRVQELERSLEQAQGEPDRLRSLISERDQQRRVAEQRAHAEYVMRVELEDTLSDAGRGDDERRRLQDGELAAAEERVRELELELEELRRRAAEAERLAIIPAVPARSAPFDLGPELAIAARVPVSLVPVPSVARDAVWSAELRSLREERRLVAARSALPAQREARRSVPDGDAGQLANVLAELRAELEQLAEIAEREAGARALSEERVHELEQRIAELQDELHERDERAQRAFDRIGELRALLARLAGGRIEPPASGPPHGAPAEPPHAPSTGIEIERFDAALERLRAAAGAPDSPADSARGGAATRPWLREAFATRAARDPATAGELLLELLPAQGAAWNEPLAYDLVLAPNDVVQLTSAGGGARPEIERTGEARALDQVVFRVSGDHAQLARLILAGGFRRRILRRGLARVQGDRAALAAPAAILDTRLDLAQLHAAGVRPEPRLALALVTSIVRPSWTAGERFSIAYDSAGPRGSLIYLHVRGGEPLTVTDSPPLGPVATTVSCPADELLAVLSGDASATASISGDPGPLLALASWLERAQRG